MPLDDEFRRHLHEVMVETSLGLNDELNNYKREIVWKAQKTRNAAALPKAYSDAAIHAFRVRTEAIIARYFDALENCKIHIDDAVEGELLSSISSLIGAKPPLSFPPAVNGPNLSAVQQSYKTEIDRVGSLLYRKAANRLREAKIKSREKSSGGYQGLSMPITQPFTIASVANGLTALKAMAKLDQAMSLLRRLAHIYPHMRGSGLHKGNLLLPGDPYGLGTGLPPSENMPVRQHLLGAP